MPTLTSLGPLLGMLLLQPGSVQKISFVRHYHLGATEVYELEITTPSGPDKEQRITMTSTQTVKKVCKDGGAEIEFTSSNFLWNRDGKPSAIKVANPTQSETMRVSKVGSPNELSDHNGVRVSWIGNIDDGLAALKNGLAVGQSAPFESVDPPLTNLHTSGTVRLVEVKSGVARLTVVAEETIGGSQHLQHITGTYWIRVAGAKLEKADFTETEVSPGKNVARMVMTRTSGS